MVFPTPISKYDTAIVFTANFYLFLLKCLQFWSSFVKILSLFLLPGNLYSRQIEIDGEMFAIQVQDTPGIQVSGASFAFRNLKGSLIIAQLQDEGCRYWLIFRPLQILFVARNDCKQSLPDKWSVNRLLTVKENNPLFQFNVCPLENTALSFKEATFLNKTRIAANG